MDAFIKRFDALPEGDLMFCEHRGVAYQRNMARGRIAYDKAYFRHYEAFRGTETERALNAGRVAMVQRYSKPGARLLDIGIGAGAFVEEARRAGFDVRGFDVNPAGVSWLRDRDLYAENPANFDVVTFWDSLEHIDDPHLMLRTVPKGAVVVVAIPVFAALRAVRASKHFKPGEHFYYFTAAGFTGWMAMHGFRLLGHSNHETDAGRESIGAFAFKRDLPDFRAYIGAYQQMHATRFYGSSATELHLATVASVVAQTRPQSIVDFGCGRSDLVAHFWRDGERRIARYDPAIPALKTMPEGPFDLALVCDVMEHIPMSAVDRVLEEVRALSETAVFTISTKPARARLPDGSNAHVTLLTKSEWTRWIADTFGGAVALPSKLEHELVLIAGPAAAEMRLAA